MVLATHWFWNLVFCFLILSMVLAIHWFWNLGCLGFIHGFWLPIDSFWLTCACWKCCFAIAKQRINLKTCIWLRRYACFEKWCFPSIKQHTFWIWASRLGETLFHHRICQKSGHHSLPFSYIYIYIYILCAMLWCRTYATMLRHAFILLISSFKTLRFVLRVSSTSKSRHGAVSSPACMSDPRRLSMTRHAVLWRKSYDMMFRNVILIHDQWYMIYFTHGVWRMTVTPPGANKTTHRNKHWCRKRCRNPAKAARERLQYSPRKQLRTPTNIRIETLRASRKLQLTIRQQHPRCSCNDNHPNVFSSHWDVVYVLSAVGLALKITKAVHRNATQRNAMHSNATQQTSML